MAHMTINFIVSQGYGISPPARTFAFSLALLLHRRAVCLEVFVRVSAFTFSSPTTVAIPRTFPAFVLPKYVFQPLQLRLLPLSNVLVHNCRARFCQREDCT